MKLKKLFIREEKENKTTKGISHRGFVHEKDLTFLARVIMHEMLSSQTVLSTERLSEDLKKYFKDHNYVVMGGDIDSNEIPEPITDPEVIKKQREDKDGDTAIVNYIAQLFNEWLF